MYWGVLKTMDTQICDEHSSLSPFYLEYSPLYYTDYVTANTNE